LESEVFVLLPMLTAEDAEVNAEKPFPDRLLAGVITYVILRRTVPE
jgi:hypothetical protein